MKTSRISACLVAVPVWTAAVILLLRLLSVHCFADNIIPNNRLFDWNAYTGVQGGIPTVTTVHGDSNANGITDSLESIDNTGATEVTTAIQSAISAAASNTVVVLPAGKFLINASGNNNTISITASDNGVVVRGQGPGVTFIENAGGSGGLATWNITDGGHDYDFASVTKYNVSNTSLAGGIGGDSNITTSVNHTFSVGELIWIDQRTNTHYVFLQGVPDPCNFCSGGNRYADQRIYGQISKVVAVPAANQLTISPPIAGMFQSTNSPQIMKVTSPVQRVGFEGITFTNRQTVTAQYMFYLVGSEECWFKNCEFAGSYRRLIHAINTFRMSVFQCYFHDGIGSDWTGSFGPNRGYAIYLAYGTSGARVEDNIFEHLHFAISFEGAIAYNVAYGNFHTNQIFNNRYTAQPSIGHHGGTATHCYLGHNVVNSMFSLDTYWGPGNNYVIFRNWIRNDLQHDGVDVDQYAIGIDIWFLHRDHCIVGNVIGRTGDDAIYPGDGQSVNQGGVRTIYRFGNVNANDTSHSSRDNLVASTMLRSNNWNAVTAGVQTDEQISVAMTNDHMYAEKPVWWGTNTWPTIGNDKTPTDANSMWTPAYQRYLGIVTGAETNYMGGGAPPSAFIPAAVGSQGKSVGGRSGI